MTDFDLEQERHMRRIALMREMGKINRQETRNHILMAVAVTLGLIALLFSL